MATTVQKLERAFSYNGVQLPDPGANLGLEKVRDVFSAAYPELVSAAIEGPERKGNKLVYSFRKAVGAKA